MKTIEYIYDKRTTDRDAWIEEYRSIHGDLKLLEEAYGETCTQKPSDTIKLCYDRIGEARTKTVIASLISYHGWDGRISAHAKRWATTIADAFDTPAAERISFYTNRIHMAHLDQLACELAKQ